MPPGKTASLGTVPPEAHGSSVIARVVVMSVYDALEGSAQPQAYASARVIEAIIGVKVGQIVQIKASPRPSCSTLFLNDKGTNGMIAGDVADDQIFVGFWDMRHARKKRGD